MTNLSRPLLAAMASDDLRIALAEVLLADAELSPKKRQRALATLVKSGVLTVSDGSYSFDPTRAAGELRTTAPDRPTGVNRFLTREGRIDRYPSDHATRVEFLDSIASRVLDHGARYSEAEVTELLGALTDDPVLLRRHLIDYGIVERTASGSEYWLRVEL